jgi:hypothetical protein
VASVQTTVDDGYDDGRRVFAGQQFAVGAFGADAKDAVVLQVHVLPVGPAELLGEQGRGCEQAAE